MNYGQPYTVGILALQGGFAEHADMARRLGYEVRLVRDLSDTQGISACILPGGESTTLMKLMAETKLDEWLKKAVHAGMPVFGTCAGLIVLGNLGLLDVEIDRNAYGPQLHSFETDVEFEGKKFPAVFIRAPKITRLGKNVEVLATEGKNPALVRQKNVLAATFHPELTGDDRVHQFFAKQF